MKHIKRSTQRLVCHIHHFSDVLSLQLQLQHFSHLSLSTNRFSSDFSSTPSFHLFSRLHCYIVWYRLLATYCCLSVRLSAVWHCAF